MARAKIVNLVTKLKVVRDDQTITFYNKLDSDQNFILEVKAVKGDLVLVSAGVEVETFDYASVLEPTSTDLEDLIDQVNAFITLTLSITSKKVFIPANADSNNGDYAVLSIGANGNDYFSFQIPNDFGTLLALSAVIQPSGGAAGAGKDIDLSSDYSLLGQSSTTNSESDTATVYDLTGLTGFTSMIDISNVFSLVQANHFCGLQIDHNGIGGAIDYLGIELEYLPQ